MMLADSRLVGYFGRLCFSHFNGADASLSVPAPDFLTTARRINGHLRDVGSPPAV